MLAIVRLGAIAGLVSHNQRGDVLEHSLGLLSAGILVRDDESAEAITTVPVRRCTRPPR